MHEGCQRAASSPTRRSGPCAHARKVATAAYFRTQDGDEVDLVLETWDGRVAGFEVKAGSRVQDADLSGLRLPRDRLGERFIAGFVLNLGELAYRKEDRITVMPLSGLWSLAWKYVSGWCRGPWVVTCWWMVAVSFHRVRLRASGSSLTTPNVTAAQCRSGFSVAQTMLFHVALLRDLVVFSARLLG